MSEVKRRVGEVRPSQLLYTYGIGSIVDLPELSVLVMGLNDRLQAPDMTTEIVEERLLTAVRTRGPLATVQRLIAPPVGKTSGSPTDPYSELDLVGVQVAAFPCWLVCPACRLLASIDSGHFELKAPRWRSNRAYYVHRYCTNDKVKEPIAIPARFLVACEDGHLDDFPWVEFVHGTQTPCSAAPPLHLYESGPSGEARDLVVKCQGDGCQAERRLAEAFGRQNREKMPFCTACRPHLRDYDPKGCADPISGQPRRMRPLVLGASNTWFPLIMSSIAIPGATARIDQIVEEDRAMLQTIINPSIIDPFRKIGQLGRLSVYSDDEIWAALERKRQPVETNQRDDPLDLKLPEWQVLTQYNPDLNSDEFRLRPVSAPSAYSSWLDQVILVEKLREVQVMTGFTRLDSPGEILEMGDNEATSTIVPLSRQSPTWLPAAEVRGEGIFLQVNEARIQRWLGQVRTWATEFHQAHMRWRSARFIANPEENDPGMRYVLLHSFAHALMRQMAMEAGYTAASIRERIYARNPGDPGGAMAGILIYTAATDSEGTLGGLVNLGEPETLERHIRNALEHASLCASDPTCAEHTPSTDGISLHGAACHACLFVPETSCERGNRYLDRTVLVPTFVDDGLNFFDGDND